MKIGGIILLVFGALSFLAGLGGLYLAGVDGFYQHPPDPRQPAQSIVWGISMAGIGIFLISRANKKKRDKAEKERWNKGVS
jgi:hypothetical protein